ncbi:MAG: cbb3-type cytochrome c oxidase subunit I [Chromatiales bacterium]|nr:cbb3-type cytochrome c oxidase subunit I [Chromatiales bacterium]
MSEQHRPVGLAMAHLWVAFLTFLLAAVLGLYQVAVRAGVVPQWDEGYYISVSAHGNIMGFVLTTFFIVGFGYYTANTSLKRKVWAPGLAWTGWLMMMAGVLLVVFALITRQATVLYTFYPPLTAHWTYYVGAALLVVGSFLWCVIMIVMFGQWKKDNPGKPVPLAMYGTTANAILWLWTATGVALEVVFQLIPLAFGWVDTIDVGLARTLFSWTLHPIVYFWLIPAYIAMYVFVPQAAGGRLFSDEMGRVAFIMLLVFGLPIGFHHLYVDPFQSDGYKLFHAAGTFMVAVPTLFTGFTVMAGLEIAGRLHGGKGLFGWIKALPWEKPMVLAGGLALLMLTAGGFGGVVNASYAMNTMVHNTMWVPAHFHLIFGGTVVIMYFAISYYLWPKMTGRALFSAGMARKQLWLWTIGMLIVTIPWHWLGLLGVPRRTAWVPYDHPLVEQWTSSQYIMVFGAILLVLSALLFIINLLMTHMNSAREDNREVEYAEPIHPVLNISKSLNGFAIWNWILLVYMVAAFAYPILQFWMLSGQDVMAWGW